MAYTKFAQPTISELSTDWVKHFYSSDRAIQWGEIEQEKSLWLDEQTLLLGKIDAQGLTEDGDHFFADWKTISGYNKNKMDAVKAEYRLDPQMLTYGVLCASEKPDAARFMVRWAMKNVPPLFFYEWYRYSAGEIAWWRDELKEIGRCIREDRINRLHFTPNLQNCTKWGAKNICPFYEQGCSKQNWSVRPEGMIDRVSHLQLEREYLADRHVKKDEHFLGIDIVILDATRVDTWLTCNEQYRKKYLVNLVEPVAPGSALETGIQFHELMATYYSSLKESQHGR